MPPGTVIRSFASGAASPVGLTWDGGALWYADMATQQIRQIDPVTGTITRSFASPSTTPTGLAWDGRMLWCTDDNTDLCYQVDPITGTAIRSFATPANNTSGVVWDGRTLWMGNFTTDLLYQVDPVTGRTIRSFASPTDIGRGLAWDGRHLWQCGQTLDRIFEIDPVTGTTTRSFGSPNTIPVAVAWDGRTLWHIDRSTDLIYQLSVIPGASYADRVIATGPIGYWPQWEAAGTISFDISGNSPLSERDGAYTGVALGQPGIGDGRTSALFDGVNDFVDVTSAGLIAAFSSTEGTIQIWCKMLNAGIWTDGDSHRAFDWRRFAFGDSIIALKLANNSYDLRHAGNAVVKTATKNTSTTDWFALLMTWSIAEGSTDFYFNGASFGSAAAPNAWTGALVEAIIGSQSGASNFFSGWLAHCAIWDRPLTPAEALSLGVV